MNQRWHHFYALGFCRAYYLTDVAVKTFLQIAHYRKPRGLVPGKNIHRTLLVTQTAVDTIVRVNLNGH
jgi:hypothetical protein